MSKPETPMIFRTFRRHGDVIAIMPTVIGTNDPYTCQSYQHVGQHGACVPDTLIAVNTRPATAQEIVPLKAELTSLGYNVREIKRLTKDPLQTRRAVLTAIYKGLAQ